MSTPEIKQPLDDKAFDLAFKHLENIKTYLKYFVGQEGHNPHIWVRDNIDLLLIRYDAGERSEDLLKAILGLKETPPTVPMPKFDSFHSNPSKKL